MSSMTYLSHILVAPIDITDPKSVTYVSFFFFNCSGIVTFVYAVETVIVLDKVLGVWNTCRRAVEPKEVLGSHMVDWPTLVSGDPY